MNRSDFQRVSQLRVAEAKVLLDNGYFAGAYYLLGYAVECALKACISKQIKRYDFPDRKLVNDSYTHDLDKLLIVAGLEDELKKEFLVNPTLETNWRIVRDWSEQSRYDTTTSEVEARSFYSAVTARRDGVLAWLKKWW
jgi:HEPN domain-containing protein